MDYFQQAVIKRIEDFKDILKFLRIIEEDITRTELIISTTFQNCLHEIPKRKNAVLGLTHLLCYTFISSRWPLFSCRPSVTCLDPDTPRHSVTCGIISDKISKKAKKYLNNNKN